MNLYCIKHPKYDGKSSPVLSCKTCCSIFIGAIRERNAGSKDQPDTYKWLEDKAREATDAKTSAPAPKRQTGNPPTF